MVIGVDGMEYTIPFFQKVRMVNSKTLRLMRLNLGKILALDPIARESVICGGSLISLNTTDKRNKTELTFFFGRIAKSVTQENMINTEIQAKAVRQMLNG